MSSMHPNSLDQPDMTNDFALTDELAKAIDTIVESNLLNKVVLHET